MSLAIMPDISEYLTVEETAEALGYHVKSVYRLISRGDLKAEKKGFIMLVHRDELDAYREKNQGKSKHDPTRGN